MAKYEPDELYALHLRETTSEVEGEVYQQVEKWGRQRHPDHPAHLEEAEARGVYKALEDGTCQALYVLGKSKEGPPWSFILLEEVFEALAAEDRIALREELIQVAAVCVSWIDDIDDAALEASDEVGEE